MHFATYKSEPKRDCNSLFVQKDFKGNPIFTHTLNFSAGIETERSTVSTWISRHVTLVLGGTNFLTLTDRPNSYNSPCNLMKVLPILEGRDTHKKSSI